ncbi:Golgi SNAP receptor complex member 1 [Wickerhamomyces ciferrii]|uniref:Golgi SNAP receptor complex member 1 n=1 Tax=Wickerhamomyces ciferrii (strain ATCC 14091 / BCRC 22168 / CBS 111 / JCM 3599 / NBRC 0793 / NRRL Y-1031 F-60-10) TaxID=1206466 RepID=K0KTW3_WICCF|nr:Golgi SNAP receptor complex member 1 [Wickerhamomyces ciferrii]CCH44824.1 Golgi SNAP receptor complex member 1 [Wickerhamomyces ciferrii]
MSSFTSIRSQAVSLENQTNTLLSKFSRFTVSSTSEPTADEVKLEKQIDEILHKVKSDSTISTVKLQQLSRHKELLQENWKNFATIKSSILQERNKLNLLFNVKNDIENHNKQNQINNDLDYIQDESIRVNKMNNFTDSLISRAYETRESLLNSNNSLSGASSRITNTISTIPGINVIISKINTRRKRDALILSTLISICILILFFTR